MLPISRYMFLKWLYSFIFKFFIKATVCKQSLGWHYWYAYRSLRNIIFKPALNLQKSTFITEANRSLPLGQLLPFIMYMRLNSWPGSSVGIATELRAGRYGIESRWGRDFTPLQTGPGVHPASCKMGSGSFPGVKCGRGVLLTTHPLLVLRSWKSSAIPTTPLRSALFWVLTQEILIISCWHFGTAYRSHLQGSRLDPEVGHSAYTQA